MKVVKSQRYRPGAGGSASRTNQDYRSDHVQGVALSLGGVPGAASPFPEKCPQDNACCNQGCNGKRCSKPGRSLRQRGSCQRGRQRRQNGSCRRSCRSCNRLAYRKNAAGDDISPVIEFLYRQDRERPGSIRRNRPVNGHDDADVTVCSSRRGAPR